MAPKAGRARPHKAKGEKKKKEEKGPFCIVTFCSITPYLLCISFPRSFDTLILLFFKYIFRFIA